MKPDRFLEKYGFKGDGICHKYFFKEKKISKKSKTIHSEFLRLLWKLQRAKLSVST